MSSEKGLPKGLTSCIPEIADPFMKVKGKLNENSEVGLYSSHFTLVFHKFVHGETLK